VRLAPADLGGGVDAAVEALVEAGEAEGEAHLLVGAAGGDAGPHAAAVQLVQGADDAGGRHEVGPERRLGRHPVALGPLGQGPADLRLDLHEHRGAVAADEALDHLLGRDRPAQLGDEPGLDPDDESLAVHEHPVAVEHHQVDRSHPAEGR